MSIVVDALWTNRSPQVLHAIKEVAGSDAFAERSVTATVSELTEEGTRPASRAVQLHALRGVLFTRAVGVLLREGHNVKNASLEFLVFESSGGAGRVLCLDMRLKLDEGWGMLSNVTCARPEAVLEIRVSRYGLRRHSPSPRDGPIQGAIVGRGTGDRGYEPMGCWGADWSLTIGPIMHYICGADEGVVKAILDLGGPTAVVMHSLVLPPCDHAKAAAFAAFNAGSRELALGPDVVMMIVRMVLAPPLE